ncbi:hypothetical protein HYV86_05965 [Candidatus Woesearchaeota archaeon]|nr:hypothetical protein [Candidatus Woesearchaeota archaeon]
MGILTSFIRSKKGSDWLTPNTLMIIILVLLLGMALLFYAFKLRGKLLS